MCDSSYTDFSRRSTESKTPIRNLNGNECEGKNAPIFTMAMQDFFILFNGVLTDAQFYIQGKKQYSEQEKQNLVSKLGLMQRLLIQNSERMESQHRLSNERSVPFEDVEEMILEERHVKMTRQKSPDRKTKSPEKRATESAETPVRNIGCQPKTDREIFEHANKENGEKRTRQKSKATNDNKRKSARPCSNESIYSRKTLSKRKNCKPCRTDQNLKGVEKVAAKKRNASMNGKRIRAALNKTMPCMTSPTGRHRKENSIDRLYTSMTAQGRPKRRKVFTESAWYDNL